MPKNQKITIDKSAIWSAIFVLTDARKTLRQYREDGWLNARYSGRASAALSFLRYVLKSCSKKLRGEIGALIRRELNVDGAATTTQQPA